jgi:SAM-dependent methyltransferase
MSTVSRLLSRFRSPAQPAAEDRTRITRMFRNQPQLDALARLLREPAPLGLRIAIYGVADGAEAASLLIALDPARSALEIRMDGFDINDDYLRCARAFSFTAEHFGPDHRPSDYPDYLEQVDDTWELAARWRAGLTFERGNVLAISTAPASYDAVLCQNVLISLPPAECATALHALGRLVRPDGLLVVGGGPLGTIPSLAAADGFVPILDQVDAIHEAWSVQRAFYANAKRPYWALEPFDAAHPDGPARYATIFRRAPSMGTPSHD